jgi:hypothetical protein
MRKLLTWVRRLVLLGMLLAVARLLLRRMIGSGDSGAAGSGAGGGGAGGGGRGGEEILPPIVGDTWPPVPTNPDRGD